MAFLFGVITMFALQSVPRRQRESSQNRYDAWDHPCVLIIGPSVHDETMQSACLVLKEPDIYAEINGMSYQHHTNIKAFGPKRYWVECQWTNGDTGDSVGDRKMVEAVDFDAALVVMEEMIRYAMERSKVLHDSWDLARQENRRVFYQPETGTLRTCPENYMIAYQGQSGAWIYEPDGMITSLYPELAVSFRRVNSLGIDRRRLSRLVNERVVELDAKSEKDQT